ncbi:hypothetical protein BLOT_015320 [Blomia tropicalis]|nr:hypothetical protein BLOT_015320 [Blomia tropicalis]
MDNKDTVTAMLRLSIKYWHRIRQWLYLEQYSSEKLAVESTMSTFSLHLDFLFHSFTTWVNSNAKYKSYKRSITDRKEWLRHERQDSF